MTYRPTCNRMVVVFCLLADQREIFPDEVWRVDRRRWHGQLENWTDGSTCPLRTLRLLTRPLPARSQVIHTQLPEHPQLIPILMPCTAALSHNSHANRHNNATFRPGNGSPSAIRMSSMLFLFLLLLVLRLFHFTTDRRQTSHTDWWQHYPRLHGVGFST